MASFESLREGAYAHGIVGKDFEKMIKGLEDFLNKGN